MKNSTRKRLVALPVAVLALILIAMIGLLISNILLPRGSKSVERLSAEEKARLVEIMHLRRSVGAKVWPGWDAAEIPLVVFNEEYAFLVGYPGQPPAGWTKVPANTHHGGPWESVADDDFHGDPYYRLSLPADGSTPQAFTVRVGDNWAGSLQTKEWMDISLVEMLREDIPGILEPIFPYRLAVKLLLGGSDKYISTLLHESFHAFQGQRAAERLAATERSVSRQEGAYPWHDEAFAAMWKTELDLLRDALEAGTRTEKEALAQQFLDRRAERREKSNLSAQAVRYEQEREWLEGLAKYAELEVWRNGAEVEGYRPDPSTGVLSDFQDYDGFAAAWEREVDQIARMAGDEGDGRFYYSGFAQAKLLDALRPGWKEMALVSDLTLEELLAGKEVAAGAPTEPNSNTDHDRGQSLTIFFGNSRLNPDASCSAVFPVSRTAGTNEPLASAALNALFSGPTITEQASDYHSWFSNETANALLGLRIARDGTAYVNLTDIRPMIPGAASSCGSTAFLAEVETTLQEAAPTVRRVVFAIEGDPRTFYEWLQMGCTPENDNCSAEPFLR